MKITVHYEAASLDSIVRTEGGWEGGEVLVNDKNAPTLAEPVMDDIKKGGITKEGTDSKPYEELQNYKDNNNQTYDVKEGANSKEAQKAQNRIKSEDGKSIDKANEKDGEYGNGGLQIGAAAVGAVISQGTLWGFLTTAYGSLQMAEGAERFTKVPFAALGAGAIFLAVGLGIFNSAKKFDKDLEARKSFKNSVETYKQNCEAKKEAIEGWVETTTDDREERMKSAVSNVEEDTEAWMQELEDLDKAYEESLNNITRKISAQEANAAYEEYMSKREKILKNSPGGNALEEMGAVMGEGYEDLYSMFDESLGLAQGYTQIEKFLEIGKEASYIAWTACIINAAATIIMAVGMMDMMSAAWKVAWPMNTIAAAMALVACAMTAGGIGLVGYASYEMQQKAVQEHQCYSKAPDLRQGIGYLDEAVNENADINAVLDDICGVLYEKANGDVSDALETGEGLVVVPEKDVDKDKQVVGSAGNDGKGDGRDLKDGDGTSNPEVVQGTPVTPPTA